jgi:hypothetical protein
MREACSLIWSALLLLFRSRASLAAEILVLRHQINIVTVANVIRLAGSGESGDAVAG